MKAYKVLRLHEGKLCSFALHPSSAYSREYHKDRLNVFPEKLPSFCCEFYYDALRLSRSASCESQVWEVEIERVFMKLQAPVWFGENNDLIISELIYLTTTKRFNDLLLEPPFQTVFGRTVQLLSLIMEN